MSGPLSGVRVVELAGMGPVPFCGMVLADLGADVVQVDRPRSGSERLPLWNRGRRSVALDLKSESDRELLLGLIERADALIEGFRPGVAERLGIGPEECLRRNPRLVYGRGTGWGQDGPLESVAGHDLNFLALSGALAAIGRAGELPVPPLNLVGDFGGGGMLLGLGVCAALLHARGGGVGQVVDAAMIDGVAQLMTSVFVMQAQGRWNDERGTNLLDSGAPFYDVYRTADDELVAIAALERRFFDRLVELIGLRDDPAMRDRMDPVTWPTMRARFTETFKRRSRAQWCELLEHEDCCFSPVLTMQEAAGHPHNAARCTFVDVDGTTVPAPAPRFGATPSSAPTPAPKPGEHTDEVLSEWGVR
jgi:alpha-methylacyl-CoA racemase